MDVFVKNLTKEYNSRRVLDIGNLKFTKDKIYAVLGLNGSGKTTLLECIAGIIKPDGGNINYQDDALAGTPQKNISLLPQKPYLFNKTVLDNIISGLKFKNFHQAIVKQRVEKYLAYFDVKDLLSKNAKKLSGGESAKVALLRTAILESKLTLLDEPTASMDIEGTLKAEQLIREMAKKDRTVIIVTHDLYQAQRIADEVIFMDKGKVIERGSKTSVFSNPQNALVKMMLNISS